VGLFSPDGADQDDAAEPCLVSIDEFAECLAEHYLEFAVLLDAFSVLLIGRILQFLDDACILVLHQHMHIQYQVVHFSMEGSAQCSATLQ